MGVARNRKVICPNAVKCQIGHCSPRRGLFDDGNQLQPGHVRVGNGANTIGVHLRHLGHDRRALRSEGHERRPQGLDVVFT